MNNLRWIIEISYFFPNQKTEKNGFTKQKLYLHSMPWVTGNFLRKCTFLVQFSIAFDAQTGGKSWHGNGLSTFHSIFNSIAVTHKSFWCGHLCVIGNENLDGKRTFT